MDASPLKRLPVEIRIYIYELAFSGPDAIRVLFDRESSSGEDKVVASFDPPCSLALTCREVRMECLEVYFKSNTFVFRLNEFTRDVEGEVVMEALPLVSRFIMQPLNCFMKVLERTNMIVGGLRVRVGEFNSGFEGDRAMLQSMIKTFTTAALHTHFHGVRNEYLIEFDIVENPLPSDRFLHPSRICYRLDCRNMSRSLREVSKDLAFGATLVAGELIAGRRSMSRWFRGLADRDWTKKPLPEA